MAPTRSCLCGAASLRESHAMRMATIPTGVAFLAASINAAALVAYMGAAPAVLIAWQAAPLVGFGLVVWWLRGPPSSRSSGWVALLSSVGLSSVALGQSIFAFVLRRANEMSGSTRYEPNIVFLLAPLEVALLAAVAAVILLFWRIAAPSTRTDA